jgi:hypothetical protein
MLCGVLAVAFVSTVNAATTSITITDIDDTNTINVTGTGFDADETVTLTLINQTDSSTAYTFTEDVTTDSEGAFDTNLTLPSGIYGTFDLTAETSDASADDEYTLSGSATLTATPDDSNIIAVTGTGFNAEEDVALTLNDTSEVVYTFSDTITTDEYGNFTVTVIVPTSLSGDYTLGAETSTADASVDISVPDLTGPTGAAGDTGVAGEVGATGEPGTPADPTYEYVAVVLSLVAVGISIAAVMKKH